MDYVALSLYFNDGPAPMLEDIRVSTAVLAPEKSAVDGAISKHIFAEGANFVVLVVVKVIL